jgi:hypothetical protein
VSIRERLGPYPFENDAYIEGRGLAHIRERFDCV